MVEIYASIIAKKMLTNADPGYVDLTSPAGIGIGALVYNYDGDIYASDEEPHPLTGLVFDLSEPHIPAQLKPRAEPW
jgi:hypothetical protein